MARYFLSDNLAIDNNQAQEFSVKTAQGTIELFVVKHDDQLHAYQNRCPHLGIPLNWHPDEFMSLDGEHIQCSTHGALFNPADGHCFVGPCSGEHLLKLRLEQTETQTIWLDI